jgi:hypothetical protein
MELDGALEAEVQSLKKKQLLVLSICHGGSKKREVHGKKRGWSEDMVGVGFFCLLSSRSKRGGGWG